MGDALWGFEAEAEAGGGCGEPAFEHLCGGQGAEGVVNLDRVELGGVELEEFLCRDVGGIEAGLPCGVGPAGGSGEEARWRCGSDWRCGRRGFSYTRHDERLNRRHDEWGFFRRGELGRLVGFEPTTSAATERRSATEL